MGTITEVIGLFKKKKIEKPYNVTVNDFLMAKTVVTVKQYMTCVEAGGCRSPEWLEEGSDYNIDTGSSDLYKQMGNALTDDDYPIVGVSWQDALEYTEWLSSETGDDYRLPTEAEWEYAARAGTTTNYPWGDNIGKNKANCSDCGSKWDNKSTSPVKSFKAYGGLYDMHGNVWEWTCSAYEEKYEGSELVCANANDSRSRVLRGGSWFNNRWFVRSASRFWFTVSNRNYNIGFRVVRTR